jgi:hypothetical protein
VNGLTETISIRLAGPEDGPALARLAALDSARVPDGPVLLGERDGLLVAALTLDDRRPIADPFVASAELVELLRMRADRLAPRRRHMLRRWRPSLPRLSAGTTATG